MTTIKCSKIVKAFGRGAHVILPKDMIGKIVEIELKKEE